MLKQLYKTYSNPAAVAELLAQCEARVTHWRWANESMGFPRPYARELYGCPAARWIADAKADSDKHVRHGLDAQGRIVIEHWPTERSTAYLYLPEGQYSVSCYSDGGINHASAWREAGGRVTGLDMISRGGGINRVYHWQGDLLQRVVMTNWSDDKATWWCQNVYHHDAEGALERIVLEYLDQDGQPRGKSRLQYLRPQRGETLATVSAEVERLLKEAIAAQLPHVPRDEPLYCLLLCFTDGDIGAAWPPFLTWGRQSYREARQDGGEDVAYYLWAPDEIGGGPGDPGTHWFDNPLLVQACLRHVQYMTLRNSTASAQRVLRNVAAWLDAPEQRAQLVTTDDFVVAVADNTGNVDPLPGMRKAIGAERWALLKARGYV